ncbi:hypothetical protein [uncultured Tateyamaria sp.]|uniref:hypothetical protein n=1 Tax=uncultured Tateyamaria sp. TaxID=455651 RepID=UPI00263264A4|nr:hypothetical protein [uncultured Tateyamaria sp.]
MLLKTLPFVFLMMAGPAAAFGGGGVDGGGNGGEGGGSVGGGCLCVPEDLEKDARALQEQFAAIDLKRVRRLQFVEQICSENGLDCGQLTEGQASRILDHHFVQLEQEAEGGQRLLRWMLDIFLALLAAAGAVMGCIGLRANRM